MKKVISILIVTAMVCGLSACVSKDVVIYADEQTTTQKNATSEEITQSFGNTTEPETEIQEQKLSDSCDKVLYTTLDGEDYYEIVVNEEINYPKNTYSFGVIKNNQWLVEMSTQSPLLNEDNTWKSLEDCGSNPLEEIFFEYLGEGCFLYYVDHYPSNINNSAIIYNPATQVAFPVLNITKYSPIPSAKDFSRYENIVNNEQIIVSNQSLEWVVLNITTGEAKPINGYMQKGSDWDVYSLFGYSEGLFFMTCRRSMPDKTLSGFFNLNGELVIDIAEYGYDTEADYRFVNGQCSFITSNDNGVEFKITIDKTGQILSSEQV